MSQAQSLTSESRCPSVCWVHGTLSFEPTQETLSKSPFLWLPSRMPLHPGGPQGSQACSSAAWDWGPAWSPMYPSNHALELRILPHQMGWCTGCLPLGVLGSLALQGCMGPAGSRSCLTHRYARFSSHHGSLGPWLWPSEGRGRCVRRAVCSQLSPTPLPPTTSREKILSTPAPHKEADSLSTSHSHPSLLSPTNAGRLTPLHSESQDDKNCVCHPPLLP